MPEEPRDDRLGCTDCERIRDGRIAQPVNTVTSAAFVVAGAVLARDPHRVHMKEDLMERIWGYRNCGTRTLDSHASRLRRRLVSVADGAWVINNWSVGYSLRTVLQ